MIWSAHTSSEQRPSVTTWAGQGVRSSHDAQRRKICKENGKTARLRAQRAQAEAEEEEVEGGKSAWNCMFANSLRRDHLSPENICGAAHILCRVPEKVS
jgi:hypothetical protein